MNDDQRKGDLSHFPFTFTYDETGGDTVVQTPSTWTIRQVVAKAYEQLKEPQQPGDRVEFHGKLLTPYYDMSVKEFVALNLEPNLRFEIVAKTGGAVQ